MVTYIERVVGRLTNVGAGANTQTLALPREHLYNRLVLRLVLPGSSVWAGGVAAAANYVAIANETALTRIEIIANGQLVLKSYSGIDLMFLTQLQNAVSARDFQAIAVDKVGGYSSMIIDFSIIRKDIITLLPSFKFSSLDLKITFCAQATIGGDANCYVDVLSREMLYTEELQKLKYVYNKQTTLSLISAAAGVAVIDLPIGNVYRQIYMRTLGGTTSAVGVVGDDSITDIEVVQDGIIYHKKTTWLLNKALNKYELHMEYVAVTGTLIGVGMLGFDATGDTAATVDTAAFSSWKLRYTVPAVTTSVVTTFVIPQELIYPRE